MAEYRKADHIDTVRPDGRQQRAQRARNIALAVGLLALVVIFYASTVAKFGPAAMDRPVVTLAPDRSTPDPDFVPRAPVEPMPGQRVPGQPTYVPRTGG